MYTYRDNTYLATVSLLTPMQLNPMQRAINQAKLLSSEIADSLMHPRGKNAVVDVYISQPSPTTGYSY